MHFFKVETDRRREHRYALRTVPTSRQGGNLHAEVQKMWRLVVVQGRWTVGEGASAVAPYVGNIRVDGRDKFFLYVLEVVMSMDSHSLT
jgi:hypothetical protein